MSSVTMRSSRAASVGRVLLGRPQVGREPLPLLVREDGSCVLTDFGLAREEGLPSVTVTGEFAGTPHYISPEQAMPRRAKPDHRTDIYSLGITLYELLAWKRPFDGKTSQEVLAKIIAREAPLLRTQNHLIPRDLETIVLKGIARAASHRYVSARAMAADIERFLQDRPIRARRAGERQSAAGAGRRRARGGAHPGALGRITGAGLSVQAGQRT